MMKTALSILSFFFYMQNVQVFGLTGGEPAEDDDFPFMVSIRGSNNCHFCSGTIIADRWVLTSSQCYSRSWWGSVRFGSNKLDNTTLPGYGPCNPFDRTTQRFVDDVLYNPYAYDRQPWTHDLVLVHLNESIIFGANVQPVHLPEVDEQWPDNKIGTILGWGNETAGDIFDGLRTDLQKAQVPLFNDEYCSNSSIWDGWILTDSTVMKCGGEVNKTYYCTNDVGGPLLVDEVQYGIISYIRTDPGGNCGTYLGIFSPVAYFRQWIKNTTGV